MKKDKAAKLCSILGIALVIVFAVKNITDYVAYSHTLNSAPFWVWILVNSVYCLVPTAVLLFIGFFLKRKKE